MRKKKKKRKKINRPIFWVFPTTLGWRWVLIASNGKHYAKSACSYKRKRDCLNAIQALQNMASKCKIGPSN